MNLPKRLQTMQLAKQCTEQSVITSTTKKRRLLLPCLIATVLLLSGVLSTLGGCGNTTAPNSTASSASRSSGSGVTDEAEADPDPIPTSLIATYTGSTEAGTVIETGSAGLDVKVKFDDGTEVAAKEYTLTDGGTLVAGKSITVTIKNNEYDKSLQTTLTIMCTTAPEPIVYQGSGDSVIEVTGVSDGAAFYIEGNASSRHFAVKGYDARGSSTELFVNTTDPYNGTTLDPTLSTTTLEISATGDWTVKIVPFILLRTISSGQLLEGTNDDVVVILSSGNTATITGNDASRHFAVITYGSDTDLLVNTTDPYSGTVMLGKNQLLMTVNAEGPWTIQF